MSTGLVLFIGAIKSENRTTSPVLTFYCPNEKVENDSIATACGRHRKNIFHSPPPLWHRRFPMVNCALNVI